ncbi:glycosyltransferase [Acidisphaera sp. L21]|uniref:glycosyltransferase family 2 protein n=1 Tax=Acidisphaera sp. L21 TaxID=1641851 RepID=UPI00131A980E|nr:glycosyltransferase family 2 protein [Acidisphaera sp. L21]
MIDALKTLLRTVAETRREPAAPRPMTDQDRYDAWIETSEAACRAAISPVETTHHRTTLGLVMWVPPGCSFAAQTLLADCPAACSILVLDPTATLPPPSSEGGQIQYATLPPGAQPAEAVALALRRLDADMLCFFDARDRLAPGALGLAAEVAAQLSPLDLMFADEDWLDDSGRRVNPFFKPGWDPELQRGRDLVGPFTFFRRALVENAAPVHGSAWLYDLTNQVAAAAREDRIHHIPAVLCHRTMVPQDLYPAMRQAATAQLARDDIAARVQPHPREPAWSRIVYALPDPPPLVSLIIPTRDRASLLRESADGVLNRTDYPHIELLIVDNDSVEPETLALLERLAGDPRVRVLPQPGTFNWSAANNLAAQHATGSVLVFLNNDIAMVHPDWLTELVSQALQPGVGAVGAKLLYPDGRVQHAGLTTDRSGVPRHMFRFLPGDESGAFGLAGLTRQVWGVTGACLAMRTELFQEVRGLNEAFPLAYNDVDLCLRLTAHGYRVIWTPWSQLTHHEMATRPPDSSDGRREQTVLELEWLLRDWGALIECDPFLNPNLHLVDEQPQLRDLGALLPAL